MLRATHRRVEAERAAVPVLEQPRSPTPTRAATRNLRSALRRQHARGVPGQRRRRDAAGHGDRRLDQVGANQLFNIQYQQLHGHRQLDVAARHARASRSAASSTFEQKNENAANPTQGNFTLRRRRRPHGVPELPERQRRRPVRQRLHLQRGAERRHRAPALQPLRDVRAGLVEAARQRHRRLRRPLFALSADHRREQRPDQLLCRRSTIARERADVRQRGVHADRSPAPAIRSTASSSPARTRRTATRSTRSTRATSSRASA